MMKLVLRLVVLSISEPTNGLNPRKLEDGTTTRAIENKCGGCPCNSPCVQSLPPPPSPSPPPPAPKPPKYPSNNCPPPPNGGSSNMPSAPTPPSQYIYMTGRTGPPGNLYPVDHNYSKAAGRGFTVGLPILITSILLGFSFM